jgi:hypothetical protein
VDHLPLGTTLQGVLTRVERIARDVRAELRSTDQFCSIHRAGSGWPAPANSTTTSLTRSSQLSARGMRREVDRMCTDGEGLLKRGPAPWVSSRMREPRYIGMVGVTNRLAA